MNIINRNYNFFRWDYWFGQVDSRPLSLFRIVFALLLLKDAVYHLPIAQMFYSDDGLVPRSVMPEVWRSGYRFTLMDAMPAGWMVQLFFLLWIIVLVCLLVGSRTRLMSILNFIIILSIHERNPFVLNGADTMMRNLSFFMMFMPLADYYSMDIIWRRWKHAAYTQRISHLRRTPEQHTAYALPVRLAQIQIAYVYLFTFLLKLMGEPWTNGTALHQALQLSNFCCPLASGC